MGRETTSVALNGRACLLPQAAYRPEAVRANGYTCPIGPAFGRAWVLMRRRDLVGMKKKGELDKKMSLDVASGKRSLRFPRLYFTKAVNVSGGAKDSADAAYLCELVDVRYVLARSSSLTLAVNVVKQLGGEDYDEVRAAADRSGSESAAADQYGPTRYLFGTTAFDDEGRVPIRPFSWAELFRIVWRGLNGANSSRRELFYEEPELPWAPAGVPENYVAQAVNRWKFYNDLLAKFSWSIAYDPVADRFSIVEMGAVQPGLFAQEKKLVPRYDADPIEPNLTIAPGVFETRAKQHLPHHGLHDADYWRQSIRGVPIHEYVDGEVAEQSIGRFLRYSGGDGLKLWEYQGFRSLWDNGAAPYQTGLGTTIGTGIALITRAEREASERFSQIVDAIVQDEQTPLARRVYSGVVPTFMPGSRVKCMRWQQTEADGVVTEVIQHPGLPKMGADGEWVGREETPQEFRAPDLPGLPTTFAFALINDYGDVRVPRDGYTTKFGGGPAQGWHRSYKGSGYFLGVTVMHDGVVGRLVSGVPDPSSQDNRYWKPDRLFPSTSIEPGSYEQGQQICWVRFVDCPTAPVFVRGGSNYDLTRDLNRSYVGHGRLNGSHTIDGVTLPLLLARNECVNAYGTVIPPSTWVDGELPNVLLGGGGGVAIHASFWHLPSGIVARYTAGDRVFVSRVGCSWVVVSGPMPGICEDEEGNLVQMCEGEAGPGDLGGNEDGWEDVVVGEGGEVVLEAGDGTDPLGNFGGGGLGDEGGDEEIPPP